MVVNVDIFYVDHRLLAGLRWMDPACETVTAIRNECARPAVGAEEDSHYLLDAHVAVHLAPRLRSAFDGSLCKQVRRITTALRAAGLAFLLTP